LRHLDLVIDSDLSNVTLVAVAVNRVCLELGFDALRAGQIELCIAEAATNAIRHAYHGKPGHTVAVSLSADREELLAEVTDTGTAMPPEHQQTLVKGPKASDGQPFDRRSLAEGGRGLQIIYQLMDKVSYVSEERHNRLIMATRLAPITADRQGTFS
jgi:serine/threonine-protein kinase RsbW